MACDQDKNSVSDPSVKCDLRLELHVDSAPSHIPSSRTIAGVKNLLAGEQQAAVTVAVEALMDNKPEAENFAVLDPKVNSQSLRSLLLNIAEAMSSFGGVHNT